MPDARYLTLLLGLSALTGCGTTASNTVLLRPAVDGGPVVLEQSLTHHNQFNIHKLTTETSSSSERIYLDFEAPEVAGDHILARTADGNAVTHPKGFVRLGAEEVVIELQVPRKEKDNSVSFVAYPYNGTFRLQRAGD